MITARTPARRLTWILLPAPGLDFQPQTQTAFYILARRVGFCKIFLLGHGEQFDEQCEGLHRHGAWQVLVRGGYSGGAWRAAAVYGMHNPLAGTCA